MKLIQLISIALGVLLVYTAEASSFENSKPQHETQPEGMKRLGHSHHKPVDLAKDEPKLGTNAEIQERNLKKKCDSVCQACKFGCDMAIDVGACEQNCWVSTSQSVQCVLE